MCIGLVMYPVYSNILGCINWFVCFVYIACDRIPIFCCYFSVTLVVVLCRMWFGSPTGVVPVSI